MKLTSIFEDSISTTIEAEIIIKKNSPLVQLDFSSFNCGDVDRKSSELGLGIDSLRKLYAEEPLFLCGFNNLYYSFRPGMKELIPFIDTRSCTVSHEVKDFISLEKSDLNGECIIRSQCIDEDNVNINEKYHGCFYKLKRDKKEKFLIKIRAFKHGNHGKLSKDCVLILPWESFDGNEMKNIVVKVRIPRKLRKVIDKT